ncbi:MAG TPA: penicillin-binding transpeptidase domain-containing protein [Anaerolineales bacterium]|nr:penicillin-binding transpeptidase domain-containing protein [Anaerolineales bacterium]
MRSSSRWIALAAIMVTASACVSSPDSPPTPTLPPLAVTTIVPVSPETVAGQFLAEWEADDYAGMYALLTPLTQDAITPEDFAARYQSVADTLTLTALKTQILSVLTQGHKSQVTLRVTFTTALYADLIREPTLEMHLEGNRWGVAWTDAAILPELAGGNTLFTDYKMPGRANIYDRNARALVAQTEAVAVGVIPGQITDEAALLDALAPLLDLRPEEIQAKYASAGSDWYVPLGEVSAADVQANYATLSSLGGLVLNTVRIRFHPDGSLAPQVLGYLAPLSPENLAAFKAKGYPADARVGAAGLEQSQEPFLAGKPGGTLYVISPAGQMVATLVEARAAPAQAVYTTFDRDLQKAAQRALGDFTGAIVVMNPQTGEILALVSTPGYDNNLFDPANPNAILLPSILNDSRRPLLNRATQGQYPLGSVFKIVTMATALEAGGYTPDSRLNCTYAWIGLGPDYVKYDWKEEGHGVLTLMDGLIESCDTWFYDIGLNLDRLDPTLLPRFARTFGLGAPTGLGVIPEEAGLVPDPDWKLRATGVNWWPGDSVNLAIGQGDLLVTPLQVTRMLAAIANGGTLYRPQLVHHIAPPGEAPTIELKPEAIGQLPISSDNLAAIQEALVGVTSSRNGTARHRFLGLGIPVAGKTGTAEAPGAASLPHSWFVGYTLAKRQDKPDIAIVVLVENAGEGSAVAAPIFRRIVEEYFFGQPYTLYPWETEIGVPATATETPAPAETQAEWPTPTPAEWPTPAP